MSISKYTDLEIEFSHREGNEYEIRLRLRQPERPVVIYKKKGLTEIDVKDCANLVNPIEHGKALSKSLFTTEILTYFIRARESARSQTPPVPLRVRLCFDWEDTKLHALHWETLCDPLNPGTFLSTDANILLSRNPPVEDSKSVSPKSKGNLRALVVIANPINLSNKWNLSPVDVLGELARAQNALAEFANLTALYRAEKQGAVVCDGHPTFANLISHLREGYDILYLVAHGKVSKDRPYILLLEDEDGCHELVATEDWKGPYGEYAVGLITSLRQSVTELPRLIVLASCQSAGEDEICSHDEGELSALGPALIKAGVLSVIAMQGNITMESVEQFTPEFFRELDRDGQIDRAMAAARIKLILHHRPDWWMPVLFMQQEDGRIFADDVPLPIMQAPRLPDQYVERLDELRCLKKKLLPGKTGGPLPVSRVILHGMGGLGKSAMAAAFARDKEVQNAFPDGILWVTLGKEPDLPQRLARWGLELAAPKDLTIFNSAYFDTQARRDKLRDLLEDKVCLLVVDDVWEEDHVEPFSVGGSKCLLLITSREANMLDGAIPIPLNKMTEAEALALMANWAGGIPDTDRDTASKLAEGVGYLPLALKLIAAQATPLRGGWQEIYEQWKEHKLQVVKRGREPKDDKEDSLICSLELSWERLKEEDQRLYRQLGVFPEDAPFPLTAAAALWDLEVSEARKVLIDFAEQALLTSYIVDGNQWYAFHDVLYEFVSGHLRKNGELEQTHAKLVAGYSKRCRGMWVELESDGYIHDHLAWHMYKAGLLKELYALIDKPWKNALFDLTFSHRTFVENVDLAIKAASKEEPINWVQLVRGCQLYAKLHSMATSVPPEALGVLAQTGDPNLVRKAAIDYATLIWDTKQQRRAYRLIGEAYINRGEMEEAKKVLELALASASTIEEDSDKGYALVEAAKALAQVGDVETLRKTLTATEGIGDEQWRARALAEISQALVQVEDAEILRQALELIQAIESEEWKAYALGEVSQALAQMGNVEILRQALELVQATESEEWKAHALGEISQALAQVGDVEILQQALGLAQAMEWKAQALRKAARERLGQEDVGDVEARRLARVKAKKIENNAPHIVYALSRIAQALVQVGQDSAAIQVVEQILEGEGAEVCTRDDCSPQVLITVAQVMVGVGKIEELRHILEIAYKIRDQGKKAAALAGIAQALAQAGEQEASVQVAQQALKAVKAIAAEYELRHGTREGAVYSGYTIGWIAQTLIQAGEQEGLQEVLSVVKMIKGGRNRAEALSGIAQTLAKTGEVETLQQLLTVAQDSEDETTRNLALIKVAEALVKEQTQEAATHQALRMTLANLNNLVGEGWKADWLGRVLRMVPQVKDIEALGQARKIAEGMEDGDHKLQALSYVAQALLQIGNIEEARQIARKVLTAAETTADDRVNESTWLDGIAQSLAQIGEMEVLQKALRVAQNIKYGRAAAMWLLIGKAKTLARDGATKKAGRMMVEALKAEHWDPNWLDATLELGDVCRILVQVGDEEPLLWILNMMGKSKNLGGFRAEIVSHIALALAPTGDIRALWYVLSIAKNCQGGTHYSYIAKELSAVARAFIQVGEIEALQEVLEAIEEIPEVYTIKARSEIAQALAQAGEIETAAQITHRVLEITDPIAGSIDDKERVRAWIEILQALVQLGEFETANQVLEQIRKVAPFYSGEASEVQALLECAKGLAHIGEMEEAAQTARSALEIATETRNASVLGEVAQVLAQLGQVEELRKTLRTTENIKDLRLRAEALGKISQALAQINEVEALKEVWATAKTIGSTKYKAEAFNRIAPAILQTGQKIDANAWQALQDAFEEARLIGCRSVFDVLQNGSTILAAIDRGQTLWEVCDATMEVERWWKS